MSKRVVPLVDITDCFKHFLATKEIGGIPRLLFSIFENRDSIDGIEFCVFVAKDRRFKIIRNLSSLDVTLIDHIDFQRDKDNLAAWIDLCSPDLADIESVIGSNSIAHYYFLSSQWDTFPTDDNFIFLRDFLADEDVTFLHHDSYLLQRTPDSPSSQRFLAYWKVAIESDKQILFISEHTKAMFEEKIGKAKNSIVAHYDFALSYPRVNQGVAPQAVQLSKSSKPYQLVFSVLDGRKSPVEVIRKLVEVNSSGEFEIALIVRFAHDNKPERMQLIDLVIENNLSVFYAPNDSTYLWLIQHANKVFYPSSQEGFGMVPLDCKVFGKACYIPSNADYAYLHDNAALYDINSFNLNSSESLKPRALKLFGKSNFAQSLFHTFEQR